MLKWSYKLPKDDVLTRVRNKVQQATSDNTLQTERERVAKYYNAQYPRVQRKGNSTYISQDVFDAVEAMKAQLLETFAGGHEIVRFDARDPRNPQEVQEARICTKYLDEVVFDQNDGFEVFCDAMHDGLTSRNGVAKVYWAEEYETVEEEFSNKSQDDVMALASQPEISDLEANIDQDDYDPSQGPSYSGSFTRKIDKCHLVIEAIPPEEFYVEPRVKRIEDGVRGHRTLKTKAELLEMGFSRADIENIGADDAADLDMSPEALARHDQTSAAMLTGGNNEVQEELREVFLYETYIKLSLKGDGKAALYRVLHAGNSLLDIDEVDDDPFVWFAPMRVPHTWWGSNYASRVVSTQNARTLLTRSILDQASMTNNARWLVVQGGLTSPRELLDERQGGIVNVTRPDAVLPMPYGNLNPFVFQTIEMLKANKEENTGISELSQGLNKDAVSSQNSTALIDNLVTLSQIRQKIIARRFGFMFLRKLYLKAYKIIALNEKKEKIVSVSGDYYPVNPKTWRDKYLTCSVSLHLGYGEQEKEAQKYVQAYTTLSQDPVAQSHFKPDGAFKLLTDTMSKNGLPFVDYFQPQPNPPPPPDPIEQAKVQVAQAQAQASQTSADAAKLKAETNAQVEMLKLQLQQMNERIDMLLKERDADRKDLEVASKINVAQRELALAETLPDTSQKAFYAPNP